MRDDALLTVILECLTALRGLTRVFVAQAVVRADVGMVASRGEDSVLFTAVALRVSGQYATVSETRTMRAALHKLHVLHQSTTFQYFHWESTNKKVWSSRPPARLGIDGGYNTTVSPKPRHCHRQTPPEGMQDQDCAALQARLRGRAKSLRKARFPWDVLSL